MATCGHWQPYNIFCGMYCADAVFTNVYLLGQRYCNLFERSFKRFNASLIMEQIKLQCLCSVALKDISETKLGKLLHLNVES